MIPLTAVIATTATKPATSFWKAALWSVLFSAIVGIGIAYAFPRGMTWLYVLLGFLTGVAPVLGYQVATSRPFSNWLSILGGVIGSILLVILWPICVGLMTKGQSFGRLLLWSMIGFFLALVVWSIIAFLMGQDPTMWVAPAFVIALAVWGGTVGGAMARYENSGEE